MTDHYETKASLIDEMDVILDGDRRLLVHKTAQKAGRVVLKLSDGSTKLLDPETPVRVVR